MKAIQAKRVPVFFTLVALAMVAFVGCDKEEARTPAECEAIVERCHALDPGTGPIHECHEFAESSTSAALCIERQSSCFAVCVAGGGDAGAQ